MKTTDPYRVRVVVDPLFGERLTALPPDEPIWIVDSPSNTPVAHRLWRERATASHLTGITTFSAGTGANPEDEFLAHLDDIELHHGNYSADAAYSVIEVIGCVASDPIRAALSDLGFIIDSVTWEGFIATKHEAEPSAGGNAG